MKTFKELILSNQHKENELMNESKIGKAAALGFAAKHRNNRTKAISLLNKAQQQLRQAKNKKEVQQKIDQMIDGFTTYASALELMIDMSGNNISVSVANALTSDTVSKKIDKFSDKKKR